MRAGTEEVYGMNAVKINVNVDKKTKQEADAVFKELGLNMSTAINMFLKKSVMEGGIPFDVTISKPNRETLDAIKEAEEIVKNPEKYSSYSNVDDLKAALEA